MQLQSALWKTFHIISSGGKYHRIITKDRKSEDHLASSQATWKFVSNVWSGMSDRERGVLARRSGHPQELKDFMFNTNEHVLCLGKKWPVFWLRDKKIDLDYINQKCFLILSKVELVFWKAWTHFPLVCRVLELPSVLGESRYLGEWIEKVKDRANELSQQIRQNDLQLQKLNEEKQEALEQLFVHISVVGLVLTNFCVCVPLLRVLIWATHGICVCRFISSFSTMAKGIQV